MNLHKAATILTICLSLAPGSLSSVFAGVDKCLKKLPTPLTIKEKLKPAYCRTKARAEKYNRVVESKIKAVSCKIDGGFVVVQLQIYDVYKIQKTKNKYAIGCHVTKEGDVVVEYKFKDAPGFFC